MSTAVGAFDGEWVVGEHGRPMWAHGRFGFTPDFGGDAEAALVALIQSAATGSEGEEPERAEQSWLETALATQSGCCPSCGRTAPLNRFGVVETPVPRTRQVRAEELRPGMTLAAPSVEDGDPRVHVYEVAFRPEPDDVPDHDIAVYWMASDDRGIGRRYGPILADAPLTIIDTPTPAPTTGEGAGT